MIENIDSDILDAQRFDSACPKATKILRAETHKYKYSPDILQAQIHGGSATLTLALQILIHGT